MGSLRNKANGLPCHADQLLRLTLLQYSSYLPASQPFSLRVQPSRRPLPAIFPRPSTSPPLAADQSTAATPLPPPTTSPPTGARLNTGPPHSPFRLRPFTRPSTSSSSSNKPRLPPVAGLAVPSAAPAADPSTLGPRLAASAAGPSALSAMKSEWQRRLRTRSLLGSLWRAHTLFQAPQLQALPQRQPRVRLALGR